ncbi:hypothetical protein DYB37_010910 [Aphanomyces astaci]|uniref:Uncharacterized protein n=1 Tax=Aphanomyces astaci TaxID=112090 RepID=A0A3R6X8F9_APHAT|nr:hypothetical protein DYB35_009846 [Aphanomyces astaci]RHZ13969.1 hypothetical protein DYB37_010910 [Aphanomyces astaci]
MPPNKKVNTLFQDSNKLTYAVEFFNTTGNGVVTYRCMLVGPNTNRKRKARSGTHYYTAPFTAAKYKIHLSGQHDSSWTEYQAASIEAKKKFFDGQIKVSNTLQWSTDKMTFSVKATIVDVIIGGRSKIAKQKLNTMKLFVRSDDDPYRYTITIKNVMRFELAMDFVGIGILFREVASAIQHAKIRTHTAKLTGANDLILGQYVRVLVGSSLEHISDVLDHESVWAMSLAGDSSTHRGQSFFDLRVRVCFDHKLYNLHLVAIPMFDRHTAEIIFKMLVKFLDALYPPWRTKLIGMSSDGESTMTGRHRGLVTRIVATAENPVLRIWCAPHQIDMIVKQVADQQANLITRMNVKCPQQTNRWSHLGRLLTFLKSHRRQLMEYCVENRPDNASTYEWWLMTFSIAPIINAIKVTITILQSRSLLNVILLIVSVE